MTKNPRVRRAKAKFNLEQKRIRMRVIFTSVRRALVSFIQLQT